MLQFLFQINAVLLNFLFICESWKIKCITVSTKISCSTTVFNIDNNQKCFLSSKSAYYYDFWRSCDTEDWSNDAENTALITEINYRLTHIHIENSYLKIDMIFHNVTNFTVVFFFFFFLSNKCSLGETLSNLTESKLLNRSISVKTEMIMSLISVSFQKVFS